MDRDRLIGRVGDVEVVGVGFLKGYRHLFNKLGRDGTAKGNVEPLASSRVWGVVYDIRPDQVAVLDEIEGGYNRVVFSVCVGDSVIEAIGYRAHLLSDEVLPTREYLEHYVAGAREHEIPDDYVRSILPEWYSWQD